jgi:hypothetical protein
VAGVIATELAGQFRRQFASLREMLAGMPPGQWREGDTAALVPARLAYHVLAGAELYARSSTYEEYAARRRYGDGWLTMPPEQLPDTDAAATAIDQMAASVAAWLEGLSDETLLAFDDAFPWTGATRLARAMYLLRHSQNHIGELNAELRRRGLPRATWR